MRGCPLHMENSLFGRPSIGIKKVVAIPMPIFLCLYRFLVSLTNPACGCPLLLGYEQEAIPTQSHKDPFQAWICSGSPRVRTPTLFASTWLALLFGRHVPVHKPLSAAHTPVAVYIPVGGMARHVSFGSKRWLLCWQVRGTCHLALFACTWVHGHPCAACSSQLRELGDL